MAEQANLIIQIVAINEAGQALADLQRDVIRAGAAAQQGFGAATAAAGTTGREVAQVSRTVRVLAGNLISELNPALGALVSASSAAAGAARGLSLGFGAMIIGATALATSIALYVRSARDAEETQRKFNEALRTGNPGEVATQVRRLSDEIELLQKRQERLLQGAAPGGREEFIGRRVMADQLRRLEEQQAEARERGRIRESQEAAGRDVGEIELAGLIQQGAVAQEEFRQLQEAAKLFAEELRFVSQSVGEIELAGLIDETKIFRLVQEEAAEGARKFAEELRHVAESVGEIELAGLVNETAIARLVEAGRGEKELLQLRREGVGLGFAGTGTADERFDASMRRIELERQMVRSRARQETDPELRRLREEVADLEALEQAAITTRGRLEEINVSAGLRRGLGDVVDDYASAGQLMQDITRRTGSDMARTFSDTFFSVVTADFKKLSDLPRQFGLSMVRSITDALGQLATGAIFKGIQGLFTAPGFRSVLAGTDASGGGGVGMLGAPAQAGAAQLVALPQGGYAIVTPGAAPGGGTGGVGVQQLGLPPGSLDYLFGSAGAASTYGAASAAGYGSALEAGFELGAGVGTAGTTAGGAPAAAGAGAMTLGTYAAAAGVAINLGFAAYNLYTGQNQGQAIGTIAGTAVGAVIGGVIGSAAGGVGAVPGAFYGGAIGGLIGGFLGGLFDSPKKPKIPAGIRSLQEGFSGGTALSQAIAGATRLEELVSIMNRSWSPHRQVRIFARVGPEGDPGGIFPPAFVDPGQGGGVALRDFTLDDLLDPAVADSVEVWVGAVGAVRPESQLTQQLRERIQTLVEALGGVAAVSDMLPGVEGGIQRLTFIPASRFREFQDRDLLVSQEALLQLGFNADEIEAFLRAARAVDRDRSLGILPAEEFTSVE